MRREWQEIEEQRQRSADSSKWILGLGAAVAIAFVAWTQFSSERDDAGGPASAPAALEGTVVAAPVIEPQRVIEAPAAYTQGPPPSRTGRESYVGVYECVVNGQRVVSDRPCDPDARTRTLVVDQPDPREVVRQQQVTQSAGSSGSSYYPSPSRNTATSRTGSTTVTSNEAACEAVDRAIDQLNARMRQRYGAAEGEWLRAQWHDLKRQRYDLKCGR